MSRRSVLLAAILAALVVVGLSFWPEPARADFGASARFGGGHGHSGAVGRAHFGNRGFHGGVGFSSRSFAPFGGVLGRSARSFAPFGGVLGRGGLLRQRQMLGDRFRVYQRARLTGRPLPSFVKLGDAELIAQRRRLNAKFLGHDRRFLHRKGWHRWGAQRRAYAGSYASYGALGVPNDEPAIVAVQVQVQAPAPFPVVVQPQASRPEPLDPRGRIKRVGEEEEVVGDWSQGNVLPGGTPHVTLDYVAYGLPIPPLGEKYARVGNDVLRIDTGSRRIVEVVAR